MTDHSKFVGDGSGIVPSPGNKCYERVAYADRSSPPKCRFYPVGIPKSIHTTQQECERYVDMKALERFSDAAGMRIIKKDREVGSCHA